MVANGLNDRNWACPPSPRSSGHVPKASFQRDMQKLIVQLSSDLYAGHGSIGMIAQTLLPFLALAISGSFGQIGLYGPVTTRPHAADPAPDLTFTKTLSYPVNDSWSPSNLSGQLTVLVFFPDTTHNLESVTQWNAVVDKFAGKPVEFVWITGECECTLAPWLQQHPIKGWVLYDPEGKTGNAYGMELPSNVIIGTDRKIVGFFMGVEEIEALLQAIQDGHITTTRPSNENLKAFIESKQVLIDAEPFRMDRTEDHKPPFPPSYTVHVSPSQGDERGDFSGDDFWSLQGSTLKEAINLLYDVNSIRVQIPALLDTDRRYDFSLVLPEQESREQMTERLRKGVQDYFHVNVSREDRLVDVYVLSRAPNGRLPATKPVVEEGMASGTSSSVEFEASSTLDETPEGPKPQPVTAIRSVSADGTVDQLCHTLESMLDRPVVNETNLPGEFVFRVENSTDAQSNFLDRLREQLGLVLTPSQRNVEVLMLEPR